MPRMPRRTVREPVKFPERRAGRSVEENRYKSSRKSGRTSSLGGSIVESANRTHLSARNLHKDITANSRLQAQRASKIIKAELNKVTDFREKQKLLNLLQKVGNAARRQDVKMMKTVMNQIGKLNKPIWTTLQKLSDAALVSQAGWQTSETAKDIWGKQDVTVLQEKESSLNSGISTVTPKISNTRNSGQATSASATVSAINIV